MDFLSDSYKAAKVLEYYGTYFYSNKASNDTFMIFSLRSNLHQYFNINEELLCYY